MKQWLVLRKLATCALSRLPADMLEAAKLAGYGAGTDVVEFQVALHEEKIGSSSQKGPLCRRFNILQRIISV